MKQEKEWKFIEGYNEYYRISNQGIIQNKYGRKLTYELSNVGYYTVRLNFEKKRIIAAVHRLVAQYFVDNPNKYNIVKHLDNNKLNNNYLNLEWDTHQGNMQDAWKEGLCENTRNNGRLNGANNGKKSSSIPIVKLDYNLFLIKEYPSINDAAKDMDVRACTINSCCIGSARSAFGYIWKYKTDYQKIKDYWYNEFKRESTPIILDEYSFFDNNTVIKLMDGHVDHGKSIIVGVGPGVHCRQESDIIHVRNTGKSLMNSIEKIPFEIGGLGQEYHKGVIAIVPDQAAMDYASEITRMIAADSSIKNIIVITKEHYEAQGKDSILKSRAIGITEMPQIKSIVPIADIIPEPIISKQEFLEMHDKAVERSITEETYRESRAWDIKKEKKVSHKRNNKRK